MNNKAKKAERKPPAKTSRRPPTAYTPERGRAICLRIIEGATVEKACDAEGIHRRTFYTWLSDHPELERDHLLAMRMKADQIVDQIMDISDNPDLDPQRARLMVETRKWLCAKFYPRMYGDNGRLSVSTEGEVAISLQMNLGAPPVIDATATEVNDE